MSTDPGTPPEYLATVPLTAPGGYVTCDLHTTDGTPCPGKVTALGNAEAQIRASAAARGWRTILRDSHTLDVCPNHPEAQ